MTKSTSRSQVKLIASTNAIFGGDEACATLRISRGSMYRLAKDPGDPLPIRYIGGKTRDGVERHFLGSASPRMI
ncbi:MAG: DNA-binding protein [Collinsella bouchesdurhonensis]|nr:DNA-binding protein [Collinsella bouchesdurhonensis]